MADAIRYDGGPRSYVAANPRFPRTRSTTLGRAGGFKMIGDLSHHYFDELSRVMDFSKAQHFDMEPFTALSNMLRNPLYTDRRGEHRGPIGGAPQLLKVYPFFRTVEFGIHWPSQAQGRLHLNGRQVFDYEKIIVPQLDATTLDVYYPLGEIPEAGQQLLLPDTVDP